VRRDVEGVRSVRRFKRRLPLSLIALKLLSLWQL
jgi:hypothetical protein